MPKKFTVVYGPYTDEDIDLCAKGLGYGMPMMADKNESKIDFILRRMKELNTKELGKGKAMEAKKPLQIQAKQTEDSVNQGVAETINITVEDVA